MGSKVERTVRKKVARTGKAGSFQSREEMKTEVSVRQLKQRVQIWISSLTAEVTGTTVEPILSIKG
eukprot:1155624-Pelagomonas_calceolata.AAC.2